MGRGFIFGCTIFLLLLAMPLVLPIIGADYLIGLLTKAMLMA